MPRRRSDDDPKFAEQANVRLSIDEHEVLMAYIFANGLAGTSEALRPAVTAFLRRQAEEPDVRLALEARALNKKKASGEVTALRAVRE